VSKNKPFQIKEWYCIFNPHALKIWFQRSKNVAFFRKISIFENLKIQILLGLSYLLQREEVFLNLWIKCRRNKPYNGLAVYMYSGFFWAVSWDRSKHRLSQFYELQAKWRCVRQLIYMYSGYFWAVSWDMSKHRLSQFYELEAKWRCVRQLLKLS